MRRSGRWFKCIGCCCHVCVCMRHACLLPHAHTRPNQPTYPTPTQPNPKQQALRLHEAVRKAEVEVSGKYVELVDKLREESAEELGRQARAFEAEKALALQELREAGQRELQARLEKEMAAFTERLTQVGVGVLIWACVSMCDPPTDMINTTIHPSIHLLFVALQNLKLKPQAYEEARAKDKAEVEAHAQRETENAVYENQVRATVRPA